MVPDADIQVWLDHQREIGRSLIVPYVQSASDMNLRYDIDVIQRGPAGRSRISQQGQIEMKAGQATQLSRLVMTQQLAGECELKIVLSENGNKIQVYKFDCAVPT